MAVTFTSVDGTSVSTSANSGQATVLIFGDTNSSYVKSTMESIVASQWVSRSDIHVIFAETGHAFCEDVKSYVATTTYGCEDDITVCYDEGSGINSAIQNYDYAREVLDLVNQAHTENGLPKLQLDSALLSTAMQRAAEIAMYYSHTRPNGTRFNTASYRGTCKLENIAAGYFTPESVMDGWLDSPGHYANIMDSRVTSIGIGCFRDSNGVFYWVQYFDNETASIPSNSGQKTLIKTVSIKKKYLHLHTNASSTFNETDKGTTIAMEVWQENEEFSVSGRPRISASGLSFSSSDSAVATVDEQGRITLKEPGTAVRQRRRPIRTRAMCRSRQLIRARAVRRARSLCRTRSPQKTAPFGILPGIPIR